MGNAQLMLQAGFIDRIVEDDVISQRVTDGYVNATAMCKSCGKQINDYMRLSTTKDFFRELYSETGIPVTELAQSIRGSNPEL